MDFLGQSHNKNHHELVDQCQAWSPEIPLALLELKRVQLSGAKHLAHQVSQYLPIQLHRLLLTHSKDQIVAHLFDRLQQQHLFQKDGLVFDQRQSG